MKTQLRVLSLVLIASLCACGGGNSTVPTVAAASAPALAGTSNGASTFS